MHNVLYGAVVVSNFGAAASTVCKEDGQGVTKSDPENIMVPKQQSIGWECVSRSDVIRANTDCS